MYNTLNKYEPQSGVYCKMQCHGVNVLYDNKCHIK